MDHTIYLTLALFGGLLLLLSLFGGTIKSRLYVSEPAIALAFGVLVGPQALDLIPLSPSQETLHWVEHLARVTLAIALLDIATDLPVGYMRKNVAALAVMIGLVMPVMCAVSGALAWWILGLPFLSALLVGAVVTPTDPVVSSAVVSGGLARRLVPERVRDLLLAESGSNDALAFALVMLPILLLKHDAADAWSEWVIRIVLWEIVVGAVLGIAAGALAGLALRGVQRWTLAEESSLLTVSVTLAIGVLGIAKLIHSDGLIAVFAAGLVLHRFIGDPLQETKDHVHEALRRLFELPVFAVLGAILPWSQWSKLGWPPVVFALAVLLFRRLPIVLALHRLVRPLQTVRAALFVGWFGPIGIAALLYAILALKKSASEDAWIIGTLVIALSVFIHGCTATPLTRMFHDGADSEEPDQPSRDVT